MMANLMIRFVDLLLNLRAGLWNLRRSIFRVPVDYVVLEVRGNLPEYLPPVPWWRRFLPIPGYIAGSGQSSLTEIRRALELINGDPRPVGVILRLDGLYCGWGAAESLRHAIQRFRESGKRVIVFTEDFNTVTYYIACAADEIIASPVAGWNVIGLRLDTYFLKQALDRLGIMMEVIAVSPYKTSGDALQRVDMSPEQRENLDLILDDLFEGLIDAIASSREKTPEQVRSWIDQAPLRMPEALEYGLIDAEMFFDELAAYLAKEPRRTHARLLSWPRARNVLMRPVRWRSGKAIGIVSVIGTIAPGFSRRLPLPFDIPFWGSVQAGADTVGQALRRAEKNPRIAAVVLYVDSRGGSNQATELIWREVTRVQRRKPLVVCMGEYAASGGYYISTGSEWIVAPATAITGSIGVYLIHPALDGLLERLKVNRVSLQRGRNAGIFSYDIPWGEELHQILEDYVSDLYVRFKARVSEGRGIESGRVDEIAGGRIWTGRQALAHKLIDQHGDLETAIQKASALAGLSRERWTPAIWISSEMGSILPAPFPRPVGDWQPWLMDTLQERIWMLDGIQVVIR